MTNLQTMPVIKASELRIGNLISFFGETYPVLEIFSEEGKIHVTYKRDEYGKYSAYPHNLQPIPLTPEILEKAGFVKGSTCEVTAQLHIERNQTIENNGLVREVLVVFDKRFRREIQYLHQLQNLYFALTGEELEINL